MGQQYVHNKHTAGFTMVEIIVMLLLIGILSLVAAAHMTDRTHAIVGTVATLKTHLRYAQSKAMNTGTVWYIVFEKGPPSSYALYNQNGEVKPFPGANDLRIELTDGITMNKGAVFFNAWGAPCLDRLKSTAIKKDIRLKVTGDAASIPITVTRLTGFVATPLTIK